MRLPLIAPAELSPEQRPVYEDMKGGHREEFSGLQDHRRKRRADGAVGSRWLHEPKFGKPIWDLDFGAFGVAIAAAHGQGSGDSRDRLELPLGV